MSGSGSPSSAAGSASDGAPKMGTAAGPAAAWVRQLGACAAAASSNMSWTAPGYPKAWPAFEKAGPVAVAANNAAKAKAAVAKKGPRRWDQRVDNSHVVQAQAEQAQALAAQRRDGALPKGMHRPPTPPLPAASVTAGHSTAGPWSSGNLYKGYVC